MNNNGTVIIILVIVIIAVIIIIAWNGATSSKDGTANGNPATQDRMTQMIRINSITSIFAAHAYLIRSQLVDTIDGKINRNIHAYQDHCQKMALAIGVRKDRSNVIETLMLSKSRLMNEICILILSGNQTDCEKIVRLKKELRITNEKLAQKINESINANDNKMAELLGTLDTITITHFRNLHDDKSGEADQNLSESKRVCGEIAKYIMGYISGHFSKNKDKCPSGDQSVGTKAQAAVQQALKSST